MIFFFFYCFRKKWLQTKGSRYSRIDRAVFKNEKSVSNLEFKDFVVRH